METEDVISLNGGCRLEINMNVTCRLRRLFLISFMHGLCGLGQFGRLVKRSSQYSTLRKWWCWVSYWKRSWILWSGSSRLRWWVRTIKYCSCHCISIFCSIHLHRSRQCVGIPINNAVMIGGNNTTYLILSLNFLNFLILQRFITSPILPPVNIKYFWLMIPLIPPVISHPPRWIRTKIRTNWVWGDGGENTTVWWKIRISNGWYILMLCNYIRCINRRRSAIWKKTLCVMACLYDYNKDDFWCG